MECSAIRQLLAFRRPGGPEELAADDLAELARHLAVCPACAASARRQESFDAAVFTAMGGVTVPPGLRDRLLTAALAKQGAALRQRIYSHLLIAATVLLGVGLAPGIASRLLRTTLDPDTVAIKHDQDQDNPQKTIEDFLAANGLPATLPRDFDPNLRHTHGLGELVRGKYVPMIEYVIPGQNPGRVDSARVYFVRESLFDTSSVRNTQSSFHTVTVFRENNLTYVVVHTAPLDLFIKPAPIIR